MTTIKDFLDRMNDISFSYVVLRNWENLPHSIELGAHSDLDILVYDIDHWIETFPEAERVYPSPRVQFKQPIGDSFIQIDVRYVGDNYYPKRFENEVLRKRVWNENGFYTPSSTHHLIALAYHAVHHKCANTYPEILGSSTISELLEVLQKTGIGWTTPDDPTVGAFNSYLQGATSVVSKSKNSVRKKQVSYDDFSLIENEERILTLCDSAHIPKLIGSIGDEIEIEDCGDHLTADNLPEDWKNQLVDIVLYLRKVGICHNDIKVDNLMVKDNIVKIIDFGWSSLEEEDISHYPSCLGQPNRAPWGTSDNYAMKCVVRQLQFTIDEKEGYTDEQ